MATTNRILIKSKSSAAGAPATSDLQIGELAINTYTGLAYLGTKLSSSGSAGGAVGEVSNIGMPISTSTSLGTSNLTLSTTGAIKSYIDGQDGKNIDALTELAATPHATQDEYLISDNGTEKRISVTNSANGAFALVSGDATIAAGGALTIAADSVEHSMVNDNLISGFTNIGEAPASSDELLISDGGTLKAMTVANLAASSEFASAVSVTDNSGSTAMPVVFHDESNNLHDDTGAFTYKPSTGEVTATKFIGALTGNVTGNTSGSSGSTTGNAATATALANARTIGGTSFDGTANIAVGLAATATALASARTIGGTSFDGTANITPANATLAAEATALENARTIAGVSFDGTANISLNNNAITNGAGYVTANDDVSVANLKTALAGGFASNAVTIGDGSDVVTIGNDLTVTGDLIVSGDTVTVNTATLSVEDPLIYMAKNQTGSGSVDIGLIGERGDDTNVGIIFDESANVWSAITTTDTGTTAGNVSIADYADFRAGTITSDDGFAGALTGNVTGNASGSSGSCTGNAATATALANARTIGGTSFDGTANIAVNLAATATALANARTIGGTSFDGTANITPANCTTAAVATTVTITDNESTDEDNALIFTAGGDVDGGNIGLESDGTCTYNPSTGKITATGFVGALTGNVTGNTSGSAGSCTGNAATATALANARTIGGTSFDGTANIAVNLAATATALATARTIGGVSFDGTSNISLVSGSIPDNAADTSGNAATATKIASITNSNIVQLTETQTLTNKTIVGGTFS